MCIISTCYGATNASSDSLRRELAKVYTSQIGVKELTGNNDGAQIKAYLKVTGLPEGYPWCAAFCAWCFKTVGVTASASAYSPNWFPQKRLTNTPHQGDVLGIYFKTLRRIAHVGFFDKSDGAFIISVEGNTNDAGSREGNRVAKKRRLKRQITCYADWIR